jgi:predicted PurR-regulated permease PerM
MSVSTTPAAVRSYDIAAWVIAATALLLVLLLHLLPALLTGLLVYELVHIIAPRLRIVRVSQGHRKMAAVATLVSLVVLVLFLAVTGIVAFVRSEAGSLPVLLDKMADILDKSRTVLPESVVGYVPNDVDELRGMAVDWLRTHAGSLEHAGAEVGRFLAHVLVGLVIGAFVSLYEAQPAHELGPLAASLQERASRFGEAFRRVVFAQVRISAVNAILTAIYLAVVLPLFGVHLPLANTMIAVTFLVGLLPVVGNLISNTIIVILSLSVSLSVAIGSLVFLVLIHKLEYFLNARIVGAQVHAHAWELLLAMLFMEAAFGMPGVIAAPIYYAYLKDELMSRNLI